MDISLLDLKKALDSTSTNGNNNLQPTLISKVITELSRRIPALRNAIPRIPWQTEVYYWNSRKLSASAETKTDGATLSLMDQTFSRQSVGMSQFYYTEYITNMAADAAQPLVGDLKALALQAAIKQVMKYENKVLYSGDPVNSSNAGLIAALSAGPYAGLIGNGSTLSMALLAEMNTNLFAEGYTPGVWVVTPRVMGVLNQAAYNHVRFMGTADTANIGFPVAPGALTIFGIPVIVDKYAEGTTAVTGETLGTTGDSKTFTFANPGVFAVATNDQAGVNSAAPVVKVGGVTKTAGTDYRVTVDANGNGKVIFLGSAPGSTPTADYSYGSDNVFLLSLDPADICIPELRGLTVDDDLAKPVQQDMFPIRVREYACLAVKNPNAHAMAQGLILPASVGNNF